jgi:hypothetical protein
MKIIQAMKRIKQLQEKASDLRRKLGENCANLSIETPQYEDPKAKVAAWEQMHSDVIKEILDLRLAIQRTNIVTQVSIAVADNKSVTQSIAAWIHRRRDLANSERKAWAMLTDRGLQESNVQTVKDGPVTEVRIERHFSPEARDKRVAEFRSEPHVIDATLEVVNATTDLVDDDLVSLSNVS